MSTHRTDHLAQRLNVNVLGSGPATLMFVHGYGCNQALWHALAPRFAGTARIVLMDLMGCGLSDFDAYDPAAYATLDAYAADVLAVAQAFAAGPTVLVGHSVGATIGLLADRAAPGTFAAQVMVSPSPCFLDDGDYRGGFSEGDLAELLGLMDDDAMGWPKTLARLVMGRGDASRETRMLFDSFCHTEPRAARVFARATFTGDHRQLLQQVATPTLLLQSTDDLIAPMDVGRYMQRAMPDAQLALVPNTGHCPHVTEPAACIAAITAFLDRLDLLAPSRAALVAA